MSGTEAIPVDPSNVQALEAWDGGDGDYWADHEEVFDASLGGYRQPFLDFAAIDVAAAVLDIGCGNGQTTRDAARAAASGSALGVDLSARMIARARQRAEEEGVANARFERADAQVHPFDEAAFDVALSRTGAMFFGDPVAAFANIGRALRPGARVALLVWQGTSDNEWVSEFQRILAAGRPMPTPPPGAPGPFSWADPDRARSILSAAGFTDVTVDGVSAPMWFGADADAAYRFVRGQGFSHFMLRDLDADAAAAAEQELRASIEAHATADGVLYRSATWFVGARRA